jgi:hypothetical protein
MSDSDSGGPTPVTEPTTHFLEVHFDPVDVRLVVEEPLLPVRPGDSVWWFFRGVPAGWTPWIDVEGPLDPAPFETLTQSPWAVRSTVAAGADAGLVSYRATLQRGFGLYHPSGSAILRSAVAQVMVEPVVAPRLHRIQVSYRPPGDDGVGSLEVDPQWAKIAAGDVVVWEFADLQDAAEQGSWRPRIDFVEFQGPEDPPNLHLGPFATLTYEKDRVVAAGDSRAPGVYNYRCLLIGRFDGRVIAIGSPDPAIDRRGDPSGG